MKQLAFTTLALFLLPVFFSGCGEGKFRDTAECYYCKEEVKVGARKCKHCGEHPYGGDEQRRVAESLSDWADDRGGLKKDPWGDSKKGFWPWQRRWPWWKWPVVIVGFISCFGAVVTAIDDGDEGAGCGAFIGGVIIYWLW